MYIFQNIAKITLVFHKLNTIGLGPGNFQYLVNEIQKLSAGDFNFIQIIQHGIAISGIFLRQSRITKDGIQRSTHVMGHIGEERVFGHDCQLYVFQSFLQLLLLFHFLHNLFVNPPISHDDLRNIFFISNIRNAKLQILYFIVF